MSFTALLKDLLPQDLKLPTAVRTIVSENLKQALQAHGWVSKEEFEIQRQRLTRAEAELAGLAEQLQTLLANKP